MIKKTIVYTDFNDQTVTEEHYFNLSRAELIELEISTEGGYGAFLEGVSQSKDNAFIFQQFKKILLDTYGKKSEDGKRFLKSAEISKEFEESEAYSQLIFDFFTDPEAAGKFFTELVPTGMLEEAKKMAAQQATTPVQTTTAPVLAETDPGVTSQPIIQKAAKDMSVEELRAAYVEKMEAANKPVPASE